MKYSNLAFAIAATLTLTACGGGGSSDHVDHSNGRQDRVQQQTFNQGNIQGGSITTNADKTINLGQDATSIVIGGKTYNLSENPFKDNEWQDWGYEWKDHSSYGYLKQNNAQYLFFQGEPTANMPTQGSANYNGHAQVIGKDLNNNVKLDSKFNVNFADKTLRGTLSNDKYNIELAAAIKGNTFSGSKNDIHTHGGFYGPDAAELAGSFINDKKTFAGTFGAEQE